MTFSVGSVVQLKSGGPSMTVEKVTGGGWSTGMDFDASAPVVVTCVWIDEAGKLQKAELAESLLKTAIGN